ncbi:MAG: DUF4054 domain-containing protein [Methylomicrobium sp.]|nr:DUF4054 domain-containing protein [Methylomicrobium sp.]
MTPTEILSVIAPTLAKSANAGDAVALADMQIGAKLCPDKRPMIVAYLAAHILALSNIGETTGGVGGSISAMSEGQLSLSFGNGANGGLLSTSYGVEYDRLIRGCIFAPRTRVGW